MLFLNEQACRAAITSLLAQRGPGKSICPSEAARRVYSAPDDGWREYMPAVRLAAADLADEGLIEATQRGTAVDIRTAKGPVRLHSRCG